MKQSEIDRELRLLVKAEAKARRWKSVGAMPYWTNGPLFFSMTLSSGAKEGSFHSLLRFKWLELDHLLWHVLGMSSNENAPFSLHANGAFVLTGWEIQRFTVRDLMWEPGVLEQQLEIATRQAASRAGEVALAVDSLDSYIRFLDREYEIFMQKHPCAAVTVCKERLLVHMLRGEKSSAVDVARERIAKQDSGGFSSGGKTFFERALALIEA
ncbi:hypothetical protein [Burkholderia cepacia]|uniref:hypothetical protein n=1 Tax=Burkholderia cepacia TaxID=292 RepID=UPI000A9B50A8|nr:hypothetical protein [Burkholderia cepacia]